MPRRRCALVSPILCFILEMWRTPIRLLRFLTHSTALYAALAPLSTISVLGYAVTRKARFQIALFGIATAYGLISVMHNSDWGRPGLQTLVWLPFSFIATGLALGGMGLFGMQPVFFGFGFHF